MLCEWPVLVRTSSLSRRSRRTSADALLPPPCLREFVSPRREKPSEVLTVTSLTALFRDFAA